VAGVPDLYQGTELWDLSLVDPDNRRPVDYDLRSRLLHNGARLQDWQDGGAKLALIRRLLVLRREIPEAFDALPEPVSASRGVFAFRRGPLVVAVPLLSARNCIERGAPLPSVPGAIGVQGTRRNALKPDLPRLASLDCASLFADFPVAVLVE
jgi:(1->4)-alpha-D-glucan 1-alpha-D-glucosylmutase